MAQQQVRRRTARRSTPAEVDRRTDRLEAHWGSLPSMEESLGMRVRLGGSGRVDLLRMGLSGEVIA